MLLFKKTFVSSNFIFTLCFFITLFAEKTELPKVQINQNKIKTDQLKPEIVQVINKEQIQSGYKSFSQIFAHINGFRINELGGTGQNANILVRGSKSPHIQFFIDGIPINAGITGNINISRIPIAGIEKIEIYRSYIPSQLQTGNLGAAINLVSQKNEKDTTYLYSKVQTGSFNSFKQINEAFKSSKSHSFAISTEYNSAKNNFKFKNDRGTPFNNSDDSNDRKTNNGFNNLYLASNYVIKNENTNHTFSLKSNLGEQEIGGPQNTIITEAKNIFSKVNFNYSLKNKNSTKLKWFGKIHLGHDHNLFKDPLAEVGFSRNNTKIQTNTIDTQLFLNIFLSDYINTSFSTFYSKGISKKVDTSLLLKNHWKRDNLNTNSETTFSYQQFQLKFKLNYQHLFDQAFITEKESNSFNHIDYHISLLYHINDSSLFKLNAGKNTRPPTLFELFGDKGLTVGNQDLKNESSIYGEAYFQWQTKKKQFLIQHNLATYFKIVDDLISYEQVGAGLSRPDNIDKSQIYGLETQLQLSWKNWINASLNYAYTYAINDSNFGFIDKKFVPGIPQHAINTSISFNYKNWVFNYSTQLHSKEYRDELNLNENSSRVLHNILVNLKYNKFNFEFEIKNISNKQYEDFNNYPLPGRSYWFGVAINF